MTLPCIHVDPAEHLVENVPVVEVQETFKRVVEVSCFELKTSLTARMLEHHGLPQEELAEAP